MNQEELARQVTELKAQLEQVQQDNQKAQNAIALLEQRLATAETRLQERATINDAYIFSKIITGTTSGTIGTETTHSHPLGREPKFVFITPESNGVVYLTDKNTNNIKVKGSASSLNFTAYLLA